MNETAMPNFWIVSLQMAAMLCIVLAALYGVLFLSRRLSGKMQARSEASIDIICTRQMGPKKQIVLIEVLGQKMLVGVGTDSMTKLADFPSSAHAFAGELEKQIAIEQNSFPEHNEIAVKPAQSMESGSGEVTQ